MAQGRNSPPKLRWYMPANSAGGVHFGFTGSKWGSLIPLLLQMPLFFILFSVFREDVFALLAWMVVAALPVGLAFVLYGRRRGWGWYVVDDSGRPLRRATRKQDGIPKVLRNRPIIRRDEFLQRTSATDT